MFSIRSVVAVVATVIMMAVSHQVQAVISSPTDIAGSVLWLDATDASTITEAGGFVSQWNDKSAVGTNHFTQGVGAAQPQTGAASLNGLNVLTLNGSSQFLSGPAVLAGNDDDYTYLAVWRPHGTSGARSVYEQAGPGANARSAILAVNSAYGFNGQNNDNHSLVPFTANKWRTTDLEVNNANANNITIIDNGTTFSGATGNPGTLNIGTTGATIGRKQVNSSEFLDGDLAEIIVYDRALTPTEHADLQDYFKGKYSGLAHRWSFNDGTADDSIGNADGVLSGGASISGGRLSIAGAGKMLTSPIGDALAAKTMIVWTSLDDPTDSTRGSALTLQNNAAGTVFDAIVYGEAKARNWMAGSDFFNRTQNPQLFGTDETVADPGEVMIAIVYDTDNSITIYREGLVYGTYTKGSLIDFDGNSLVQIGPRHGVNNDVYDGFINEARIYNYALSAEDVGLLFDLGPDQLAPSNAIPEPMTTSVLALGTLALIGRRRRR